MSSRPVYGSSEPEQSTFMFSSASCRRTKLFRWFSEKLCCQKADLTDSQFTNGRTRSGRGGRGGGAGSRHQNFNSMRTLTTSLTADSCRTTTLNPHRVVIVEHQNIIHDKPNEVSLYKKWGKSMASSSMTSTPSRLETVIRKINK